VLDEIMALKPDTKVIVASGHGARKRADRDRQGAYDFYQKPVDIDALGLIVRRALHLHRIEAENRSLADRAGPDNKVLGRMITAAPEMVKVAARSNGWPAPMSRSCCWARAARARNCWRAACTRHRTAAGAFVAINCAAIPENLLESELFGTRRGLHRGGQDHRGQDREASGGTLFLDEVGDIPFRRSSCCASCRNARSSGSAAVARSRSIRASSAPRTRTWKR
jgi:two-component system NtrC family response regulator